MRSRSAIALSAAVSFVVTFAVYLRTLSPAVAFIDSGELTLAAATRGVPHPPGFPLWTMLTHLFTLLPIGSVAWRANLASAFYASASAALMAICIAELLLLRRRDEKPVVLLVASLFGGLSLAFSRTLWAYATITEVYTLNVAMTLAVFAALLHWRRTEENRWLYAAAGLFGAAMGVHTVMVALTLPAIALLVISARGWQVFFSREFVICLVIALGAMALVYAYEPVASSRKPPIDWGGTSDMEGFVDHVTAKQYRREVTSSESTGQSQYVRWLLARDLGPVWIALLAPLAGIVLLWKDSRLILGFIALLVAANLFYVSKVVIGSAAGIADDQDAYLLTSILSLVMLGAVAVAALTRNYGGWGALALIVPVIACVVAFPIRDRSQYRLAVRYAENALRPVTPNALVLSNNWNFISPFEYLQNVEKMRPDVEVVTIGMLPWSWYRDQLARRYPTLFHDVRAELAEFEPWATRWVETSNEEWLARPDWHAEYVRTYNALIVAMANRRVAQGRDVYATRDFLVTDEGALLYRAVSALETTYNVVPLGLVAQYAPRGSAPRAAPLELDLRGLDDSTVLWEPEDVTMQRVIEMYVRSYRMHGRYCYALARPDLADASYRAAMQLKPDDESIAREQATFAARFQTP